MKNKKTEPVYSGVYARKLVAVVTMCAPIILTGCSQIPDAVNPVEWYNSSVDFITSDEPSESQASNGAVTAETTAGDGEFPNLASVDQQKQTRDIAAGGLVADTSGRKRAPAIALQGSSAVRPLEPQVAEAPSAATQTTTAAVAPASPAMPITPVASAAQTAQAAQTPTVSFATTAEEKDFETRMARRLAEIQARAANADTGLPDNSAMGIYGNQPPTVVISSAGVEAAAPSVNTFNISSSMGQSSFVGSNGISNPESLPIHGRSVKVATILFANGSANLSSRDRAILNQVIQLAQQ